MNALSIPRLRTYIVTAILLLVSAIAGSQTVDAYLVSDFDSGNVQIFSVANNQLLATIPTGASPHDALVAAGGRLAFVPNGNSNYVSLLDLSIGAEIARLPQSADTTTPFAAAITPDGSRVLMVAPGALVIMNTTDFSLTTVPLGAVCDDAGNCDSNPADIHILGIAVAGNKAYLNLDSSFPLRIVSVDLSSSTVSQIPGTAIGFGNSIHSITVSPDGRFVIAKRVGPRRLLVIDTTTNAVTQTLTPTILPRQLVATTPGGAGGGRFVYLVGTGFSPGALVTVQAFALNGGTLTLAGSVSLFPFQSGLRIALSPDSTQLYVGSGPTVTALNTQAIVSNPAGAVTGQFAVANLITGMASASVQLQPLATAPTVTGVTPHLVVNNDTDTNRTIQVTGTNFSADALLRIGNLAPFAPGAPPTSIQAIVPAGTAAQVANLIVTDPDAGSPLTGQHQSGILRGQVVIASPPAFQPANQAVVANFGNSTAAILNVSTSASLQPALPGALGAEGIAITADGERAYVGQFNPAGVHVFNLVQNRLEAGIQLDSQGLLGQVDALAYAPSSPFGTVVYAVALHILADGTGDQELFAIDTDPAHAGSTLNTVVASQLAGQVFPTTSFAGAAAAAPGGRFVYTNVLQDFTCQAGWLVIFDMAARSVDTIPTATLNVNGCQLHIEITSDGRFMLLGGADGKIHIFDISGNPMNPTPFATITPHAPVSFSALSLPSLRIVPGTPNRLLLYDSTQNLVAAFNFDPTAQDFFQLGSISIPGSKDMIGGNSIGVTPDGSLLYAPLDGEDDVAVVNTNLMAQSNPAALLTKISTGLAPFAAAVRPGTPTPASTPGHPVVNVVPTQGISISFSDVTTAGATTVTSTNATPFAAPAGFQIASVPVYYEIATTAAFSAAVVCFQYNPGLLPSPESSLRLAHFNTAIDPTTNQVIGWEDVTIPGSPDVTTHTICGQVSSFSPFIIGVASTNFLFNGLLADISALTSAGIPEGIMRSLRAKALAARTSVNKGNDTSAENQLNALINELEPLSGNQLSVSTANTLISDVEAILNSLQAQPAAFTVLHTFAGGPNDGSIPTASVVRDKAGNLYGTTAFGGLSTCGSKGELGCGTVFKLDSSGNETVLHKFSGGDGAIPAAGLLRDAAGNLYGTTVEGGSAGPCRNFGCGTAFKLDSLGNFTVLHAFSGGSDGGNPTATLIMDAAGNLYGTTGFGGVIGIGTVFKLDALGNETVLHSFTGADGGEPSAALIMDAAGNLYGTTFRGGVADLGTVFKLDPLNNLTTLHVFTGGSDGGHPAAALIMDGASNLYGTTDSGGAGGAGTVFKLDPSNNLTVLHAFTGGSDGGNGEPEGIPAAGLVMDAAGNLFGTTARGGAAGLGTVFKLDQFDNQTILHDFTGTGDGSGPLASLVMDAAGNLYGTSSSFQAPATGFGTVFKLTLQTPQQATQAIIDSVNALFAQGVLNNGQDNSLVTKLEHSIDRMNAGDNSGAIQALDSFIAEVNALLNSGVLSPSQADPLVGAAENVIAQLT